jgi:hypothetical protein
VVRPRSVSSLSPSGMNQEDNSDQQKRNTADQERAKALEASNEAQTALYQQMQEALAKQKGQYGVSVAEELAYWSARSSAFAKGSEQYRTIQMEQFKLQADIYQQMMEGKKKDGGIFQGGFASGGDILANHPARVGEQGPELFMPHTAGRIVLNHALGGGAGYNHFHFNIQGNSDPAAIQAAVMRAAPHIVAAAVQANHQGGKRSPGR